MVYLCIHSQWPENILLFLHVFALTYLTSCLKEDEGGDKASRRTLIFLAFG